MSRRQASVESMKLPHWVLGLLVLLLVNGVAVNLFLRAAGWGSTSLRYAKRSILYPTGMTKIAGVDSWGPMFRALEALRQDPTTPLYSRIFFEEHVKFQYPPTSLLAIDGVQRLSGAPPWRIVRVLNDLSWVCVVVVGLFTATLLRRRIGAVFGEPSVWGLKREIAAFYGIVVLLAFLFYPLTRSFYLGQVQTFITLLVAVALWAWHHQKKKVTGLLVGLICVMKPHWGVVLLWAWLRRQWGMALAGTLTVAVLFGISVSVYGLGHHLDYLSVLSALSRHGEVYYANQSVNGLMHRLLFNGDNLHFMSSYLPPYHPVVYACTVISSLLLIGSALLWKCRSRSAVGIVELAIVVLSTTMASPIAWEHHYAILLPIFAVVLPAALAQRALGRWTVPYLVAAFFLASQRLGCVYTFGHTRLNVLQSHLFFSAIMVLVLLYLLSSRKVAVDTMRP